MKTPVSLAVKNAPSADFDYGRVKDETSAGAANGTAIAADIIDNIWYAMLAVIKEAGVTPSETTENTNGVNDFLDAINELLTGILIDEDDMVSDSAVLAPTQQSVKAYVDGFGLRNYLHVRDEKASGTAGGTFTSGAWQTRTLNLVKANTINPATHPVGSAPASNRITLPIGTYRVQANCPSRFGGVKQARLYNITGAAELVLGQNSSADISEYCNSHCQVNGTFTLAAPSSVELQHRTATTKATDGFGAATSWGTEVYAEMEIWKIA